MSSWLLHKEGGSKLGRLAKQLKSRHITEARTVLGSNLNDYVPWISSVENLNRIEPLVDPSLFNVDGELVTDRETLEQVAGVLAVPNGHALRLIVEADIEATIMEDVSTIAPNAAGWIQDAKRLLHGSCPWVHSLFEDLIDCIIPIRHYVNGQPVKRAVSSHAAFGAIFITFEERDIDDPGLIPQLAIDLAHELGHHSLNTYQRADPILTSPLEASVYSAVRKTLRPAIMSFHACVALAYMLEVASMIAKYSLCSDEQRKYASNVAQEMAQSQSCGLEELVRHCQFTELGSRMYREMRDHLENYRLLEQID